MRWAEQWLLAAVHGVQTAVSMDHAVQAVRNSIALHANGNAVQAADEEV